MGQPQHLQPGDWPSLLKPGMRVFLPGGPSEPIALLDALKKQPDAARGVTFCCTWLPGINRTNLTELTPTTCMEIFFAIPELYETGAPGQISFFPMGYSAVDGFLRRGPAIDLAVVHTSPPNSNGLCSVGLNADFSSAALQNAKSICILTNEQMPYVVNGPVLDWKSATYAIETDTDLPTEIPPKTNQDTIKLAAQVGALVEDGNTLEFGVGGLQRAAMEALCSHKNLRIHSGMISSTVMDLIAAGAIEEASGAVTTGFAWGSKALYTACGQSPLFAFRPVAFTHNFDTLKTIDGFVGINGVLEIDLYGQANAEFLAGRAVSGQGGLGDFIRGARAAGGKGIVALPATAKGGALSRIVPRLSTPATLSRYETDYVVTEHGSAQISALNADDRAKALIGLAAPEHREDLERAWHAMKS